MADILIRQATASDQAAIAELIGGVYAEYGDELCLDDAEKDLTEIPEYYHDRDGDFVVMCDRDEIIGCHAVLPISGKSGTCTFRRLYLTHSRRGGGYGKLLMQWAVDWARDQGFKRIEFWSDTRFTHAHGFFKSFGFNETGNIRHMEDSFEPYSEYFFFMKL
tara:strand:- start:352 stop:837 length:486 start_codon:yes stop_codon:yes gene_type:complete